jgi:hypothetical protein
MAIPQEDPVRRLSEDLLRSYEEFLEQWRMHLACCEQMQHIPFPTQAEAGKAVEILCQQRELLDQWEGMLKEGFIQTGAMLQRAWKRQMREWVAGLDEELSRLKRESD